MRRLGILALTMALSVPTASYAAIATEDDAPSPSSVQTTVSTGTIGSAGAMSDTSLTLSDMLTYALQDEYAAKAEYAAIQAAYGMLRPYSNIERSEDTHIALLLPLFSAYGVPVPVNDAASHVVLPATLDASYDIGVEAEILNIAMYGKFLTMDLPDDVRTVFERLMSASESHLAAFENAAGRSGTGAGAASTTNDQTGRTGGNRSRGGFGNRR